MLDVWAGVADRYGVGAGDCIYRHLDLQYVGELGTDPAKRPFFKGFAHIRLMPRPPSLAAIRA